MTPSLIWLGEGCEWALTHVDPGCKTFGAQVSTKSICKVSRTRWLNALVQVHDKSSWVCFLCWNVTKYEPTNRIHFNLWKWIAFATLNVSSQTLLGMFRLSESPGLAADDVTTVRPSWRMPPTAEISAVIGWTLVDEFRSQVFVGFFVFFY